MKLTDKTIAETYFMLQDYYNRYLKIHGVQMPALHKKGQYTREALVLVYLAIGYPNTRIVSKSELTEFIRLYYPNTLDVQQARHLGAQKGWKILSGTRNDNVSADLMPGYYQLVSLECPYPGFTAERRTECLDDQEWESLKAGYDYRCACCGSKEGKPHRYRKSTITKLQKGHMNPNLPLTLENTIPQCAFCNRPDRNYWIYDKKGRVIGIANAKVVDTCSTKLQKEIYIRLCRKFYDCNNKTGE